MSLTIEDSLRGAGWADCKVCFGDRSVELTASYLSDALGNLVLAACMAYSGFHSVSFGFDEEPGEYRWVIERIDGTEMLLRILEFGELWSKAPNEAGRELLSCELGVQEFASAVHQAATTVLGKHGTDEYLVQWVEHEFPSHQMALLTQMLERYGNDA